MHGRSPFSGHPISSAFPPLLLKLLRSFVTFGILFGTAVAYRPLSGSPEGSGGDEDDGSADQYGQALTFTRVRVPPGPAPAPTS